MNTTVTIIVALYFLGAVATLLFCIKIGLKPRNEKWSTALVFLGWPGTVIALIVVAAWEEFALTKRER